MLKGTIIAASLAVLATSAQAGWQEQATPFDANRLARLEESKAKGLAEAQSGGDMGVIREVLEPEGHAAPPDAFLGVWRCRTIKLGGMTPDVVYSWFRCRIGGRGGNLHFEKITGSQHIEGTLYPSDLGGMVFLGASNVKGEPMHRYSGNRAEIGAGATPDDQIGLLSYMGRGRARIELPFPVQESDFDVIELVR